MRGASHEDIDNVEVRLLTALDANSDDVLWSDAIVLGTPENFGYMSGAMKYFFDRIYYDCLEHTEGKPYALTIRAGNDGSGAQNSMERIITGLKWREVQAPIIAVGEFEPRVLDLCEELGMAMAAGLEAGIF